MASTNLLVANGTYLLSRAPAACAEECARPPDSKNRLMLVYPVTEIEPTLGFCRYQDDVSWNLCERLAFSGSRPLNHYLKYGIASISDPKVCDGLALPEKVASGPNLAEL